MSLQHKVKILISRRLNFSSSSLGSMLSFRKEEPTFPKDGQNTMSFLMET